MGGAGVAGRDTGKGPVGRSRMSSRMGPEYRPEGWRSFSHRHAHDSLLERKNAPGYSEVLLSFPLEIHTDPVAF
ncbi:hypothetical protein NDU88_000721 [Pleurodeles waltl]|uniref:Uncharacterized protein n=1 Tax=Pleurodeles waltl TaxID=8319 RepID=A0AAV7SXC0_PLEWA|nr:hypothetical protein NDU88_000721 [Pleurodeles waltl]